MSANKNQKDRKKGLSPYKACYGLDRKGKPTVDTKRKIDLARRRGVHKGRGGGISTE